MGRRVAVEQVESRVRARRLSAGHSQQALASRVGLSRQAISAIEAGQYVPNTAVALRLARALGCTVEELFQFPDSPARLTAELAAHDGAAPAATPLRVRLARVGPRVLARPLAGAPGMLTPADGLIDGKARDRGRLPVDLLVDPALVDNTVVVLGCDPALALLGAHLSRRHPTLRLAWEHAGSLAALRGLARDEAHAAGSHLRDPATGEHNLPAVRRELAGRTVQVITLARWQQGLIVAAGNPRGIHEPADLARADLRIVNREAGAGSRAMLDAGLRAAEVDPSLVPGYEREVASHLAVAEAVASGAADAGPGILAAARAFGLAFVPLQEERYDLVIPAEHAESPPLQALLELAVSPGYRAEVEALGGYDCAEAGTLVASLDGAPERAR